MTPACFAGTQWIWAKKSEKKKYIYIKFWAKAKKLIFSPICCWNRRKWQRSYNDAIEKLHGDFTQNFTFTSLSRSVSLRPSSESIVSTRMCLYKRRLASLRVVLFWAAVRRSEWWYHLTEEPHWNDANKARLLAPMTKAAVAHSIGLWNYFWRANSISVTISIQLSLLWKGCTGVFN
jgi:hypothetical protein